MTTLALISPIDPGTSNRVDVRVCSSQDPAATGANDAVWWPAIVSEPTLQMSLFDGDFTSVVEPGSAQLQIRLDVLERSGQFARVKRYDWAGAKAVLYRLVDGLPETLAVMKVERFAAESFALALSLVIDEEPLQADVLTAEYAGTTGAEGGADLKGRVKPWVFGRALNVEPVFIDQIDNVFQISGYGPVEAIPAVYERGASFGDSLGDYADYAALVAADIPEGRWGTCLAEGMFRLGAPPAGVITCDVDGDNGGGFLRRTGAILAEIADRLGLSASVNAASLAVLNTAVARNVNIVIAEQTSLLDLARRMAAPCNAVAGLDFDGRLIAPRVVLGLPGLTLDAQGREMPPVLGMARQNTNPPYKRIQIGAARSWRVHTLDEIAFYSDLIERGLYDETRVYREGDIVASVDKSRWLYISETPGSGNAPPSWPTTINAFWDNLEPPASQDPAIANASIEIDEDGDIQGIGTGNGTPVNNGNVMLEGPEDERPGGGSFVGQQFSADDTGIVYRWTETAPDTFEWVIVSDVTTAAQRTIEPEFPVVEIQEGEAGHTGDRTVTHVAKRGSVTLTGGTWSKPSQNLGSATVTVDSSTGTATISGVTLSGAYVVRYTHTDGIATDLPVNVTYVAAAGGAVSAKTGTISNSNGVGNTNDWTQLISLVLTGCPAGRAIPNSFALSSASGNRIAPASGTGTAEHRCRLLVNGTEVAITTSQETVSGGIIGFVDFSSLFDEPHNVSAGTVTITVEIQRTSGAGTLLSCFNILDFTVITS